MVARLWLGLEFHFMSGLILLLVGFRIASEVSELLLVC
jgi:hypothetical protein